MRNVITLILLFTAGYSSAQSLTADSLRNKHPCLFTSYLYRDGANSFIIEWIAAQPEDDIFYDLTKNNVLYLDYILYNHTAIDRKAIAACKGDSIQLLRAFRQALRGDALFNRHMLELSYWYLQAKNVQVTGYQPPAKTHLTTEQLMNIAAKFFFATAVQPDKTIQWKVCIGENAYVEDKHNSLYPLVEAFCFMAIMNHYESTQYPFKERFDGYASTISKQTNWLPEEERLSAARDNMYKEMAHDETLRRALLYAYNSKKDILSFKLTDQP